MRQLITPVKLHSLIRTPIVWPDSLWNKALSYVLGCTSTADVERMAWVLRRDELSSHVHKADYRREFRDFPSTLLPGALDLMRHHKAARASLAEQSRADPVQPRGLNYYDPLGSPSPPSEIDEP